jgi:hypothetical protein
MKNLKFVGAAASSSLILTTLFGVAPASAAVTELPSNANGTNNTGIYTFACEDRVIVSFPTGPDRENGLPFESKYRDTRTEVTVGEVTETFYNQDSKQTRRQVEFEYETKQPSDTVEIDFTSQSDTDDQTPVFTVEATVVDINNFAGGSGTESDPYLVSNVNQLSLMRCHDNKSFKLTKNLDLSGRVWLPIGETNNAWQGEFDGAGYTISNLTIPNEYQYNVGLFGRLGYSSVNNLKIRNSNVGGEERVGLLFGTSNHSSYSDITISNSEVAGRRQMGLFAGFSDYRSSFSNISVQGNVIGSSFVGRYSEDESVYIQDASSIGGVIGYDDADGSNWDHIKADTKIRIYLTPEAQDVVNVEQDTYQWSNQSFNYIGGIAGEVGEGAGWSNVKNKVAINVNPGTRFHVYRLGGAFGDNEESFADDVVSNVRINIKGNSRLWSIGGFSGDTDAFTASDINSTVVMNLEVGQSGETYTNDIGGFVGEAYDSGFHDIKSKVTLKTVVVEDLAEGEEGRIERIGGFIGDDEEGQTMRIQSDATVSVVPGNGSNNSLDADVEIENLEISSIGGFVGNRDDYSNYTAISSNAKVNVSTPGAFYVGGFIGKNDDLSGIVLRNVVATGHVTLAESISSSGALFGNTGAFHLSNVISSIELRPNGATEAIGYLYGSLDDGTVEQEALMLARSHLHNAFFNKQLSGAEAQTETGFNGRKAKVLKSSSFLNANGFNLDKVFDHSEGQFPVVKISAPMSAGNVSQSGQSNNDTSISFGLRLSDGSRNFFVNLRNEYARKTASLVVVRNGKVVSTINSQVTNAVGNWFVNSKAAIKSGDVLRVTIGKKEISRLVVK